VNRETKTVAGRSNEMVWSLREAGLFADSGIPVNTDFQPPTEYGANNAPVGKNGATHDCIAAGG
jgi:hypothetical protein